MSQELATVFTKRQARAITDQINEKSGELFSLLQEAHDRKAWAALGYGSWRDYATAEFNVSQSYAYRLLDQAQVVTAVRAAANSPIGEISELAARQIKPVLPEVVKEISERVAAGEDPVSTTYAVIEAKRDEVRKPAPAPKAKATDPTIETLQAENEELRAQLIEARDNARELAAMVESYDAVTAGEHAAAKEMAKLRGQLRTVEATRDQWMTTAGELRKEVKSLQRRLGASQ